MKLWRKVVTSILAAALLVSLFSSAVMAEPYSYKVTIYAGNQGTFKTEGGLTVDSETAVIERTEEKIVISGLQYGDTVGMNTQTAVAMDASSKYYVQGLRLSGRDNDTVQASVFEVKGDADYVVAYGIKGNQVNYTVYYRDANGNDLIPFEVFYGNAGDKPVVAYQYIEGYVPEALGLTKTLSDNAAENVFVFEYDRVSDAVVTPGGNAGQGGEDEGTATPPAEGESTEGEGETSTVTEGTPTEGTEETTETTEETEETEQESEAEESDIIVDLDEESVPMASGAEDGEGAEEAKESDGTLTTYIAVGVVSVIVLVTAVVVAVVIKKRGKK